MCAHHAAARSWAAPRSARTAAAPMVRSPPVPACSRNERAGLVVPAVPRFLSSPTWSPDTSQVRDQVAVRVAAGELISHEHIFIDVCPVYPPAETRKGQSD